MDEIAERFTEHRDNPVQLTIASINKNISNTHHYNPVLLLHKYKVMITIRARERDVCLTAVICMWISLEKNLH